MAAIELKTFQDLYNAVAEELKIQTSDTTSLNRIKRDLNLVYINEVLPAEDWFWARRQIDIIHPSKQTGTVTVTEDSTSLTFSSAPTGNLTGYRFYVGGHEEVYTIASHTTSSTSATLTSAFTGTSSSTASYTVYQDKLALPVDLFESYKVWHDYGSGLMEPVSDKDFVELHLSNPRLSSRPQYYKVTDYEDQNAYANISGLPALSTRASDGYIKTLVFASDVSSLLEASDTIKISNSGDSTYDGEYSISTVSSDTITYIGNDYLDESATADGTLTLQSADKGGDTDSFRYLEIYPAINDKKTTLHVEGMKKVPALELDADEPLIPIMDRIVLMYGALHRAWSRIRNPEEASRNYQLFQKKLNQMKARIQAGSDSPTLKMSRFYLDGKRYSKYTSRYSGFKKW